MTHWCAPSLGRSTSPPLQKTPRAQRAVVARQDVERRAAPGAGTRPAVFAFAALLSGHNVIAQANPALYRPFGFLVVRHSDLAVPQVAGRKTGRASGLNGSVRELLREWGLAEAGAAGAEGGLEDDLDSLGRDRIGQSREDTKLRALLFVG